MSEKKNNRCFITNVAVLLTGAVLYVLGLVSIISVFTEAFSFPFAVSSDFALGREVNLIIGVILFVLSLVFHLFFYEKNRDPLGLSGKKILFYSLSGPLSSFVVLKKNKSRLNQRATSSFFIKSAKPVSTTGRIAGALISVGAISFLIFLLFKIISFEACPRKCSASQMRNNERTAYRRLVQIYNAQKQYIKTDWDKDGVCCYSMFLVNLWQTLDEQVFPVEINLIPKELGYAMRRAHSLDGYFYVNVHRRCLEKNPDDPDNVVNVDLDHRNEFAVVAFPERVGETGWRSFIIDQSGTVRSFEYSMIEDDSIVGLFVLPPPAEFKMWRQLPDEKDLLKIQSEPFTP